MVRKLEKIEKEMGYCEIKLEKERRLHRQVEFLDADLEVLARFIRLYEGFDTGLVELPYEKIGRQIVVERQRHQEPGPFFRRAKDDFIAAGVVEMVREERKILAREKEDIEAKFQAFNDFSRKRDVLREEQRQALQKIAPVHSSRVHKLSENFKKIESSWNSLTEDAINVDESLRFLQHNVDYIVSARNFLISAKGSFDIENWVESGFAGNLFRHSLIGRAKEMIDGANRNLKLAQKELVCVINTKFEIDKFEPILTSFLDALFHDIFLDGRLGRTLDVVEGAIADSKKRLQQMQKRRDQLHRKLERTENTRKILFARLGGEKRGRVAI
jgi:septal ring factor EnvC (AmiA/AmiB activator)